MASTPPVASVRQPISLKIFGIAVALLVLMIGVTLFSSVSMRRVERQLTLLPCAARACASRSRSSGWPATG